MTIVKFLHDSIINNLPENLLIEILQRLPEAKFAIRCQLVCRNWYRTISTSYFISSFANHHHMKTPKILHFVTEYPEWLPVHGFVIASCNDLLLCEFSQTEYCICNPLTRQYARLPRAPPIEGVIIRRFVEGFVCDSYTKKNGSGGFTINPDYSYRVVFVYTLYWKKSRMVIHDFSSETNEWRECFRVPSIRESHYAGVGCTYTRKMILNKGMWFWFNQALNSEEIFIYNPQNITIHAISRPRADADLIRKCQHRSAVLGLCQGFLRFFELITSFSEGGEISIMVNVWELNDDQEWSLVHNVYLHQLGELWHSGLTNKNEYGISSISYHIFALEIDPNDVDVIYIEVGKDHNIVSCNMREMEMKHIQRLFDHRFSLTLFPVMAPLWPTPIRLAN